MMIAEKAADLILGNTPLELPEPLGQLTATLARERPGRALIGDGRLRAQALAVFDTTVGDFREALSSSQAGNLTAYKTAIAQEQTDNTTGSADFNNIGAAVCGGGGSTAATPTPS